jgi:hypothetical protein
MKSLFEVKDKIMKKYQSAVNKKDYVACLKNAVKLFVA